MTRRFKQRVESRYNVIKQTTPFTCGPTSLLMAFNAMGNTLWNEKKLAELMGSRPLIGTHPEQMVEAAQECGFDVDWAEGSNLHAVEQYLQNKLPVIVLWFDEDTPHYSVLLSTTDDYVTLADPETGKELQLFRKTFEDNWYGRGHERWWMALLRWKPVVLHKDVECDLAS